MATATPPRPTSAPALAPDERGGGLDRMGLEQYHESTAETVEEGGQLRMALDGEGRGAIAVRDLLPRADRP